MKTIPLTQGKVALVDDEDHEWLSRWKWQVLNGPNASYAKRVARVNGKRMSVYMAREIMSAPVGKDVDHINRNGLDNRRSNLRVCEHYQNRGNTGMVASNKSGYKGVAWDKSRDRWIVIFQCNNKQKNIGRYDDPADAARAYDAAARKHFGEFARLNFPGPGERGCRE